MDDVSAHVSNSKISLSIPIKGMDVKFGYAPYDK